MDSTRMVTDGNGDELALYDYAPFGEELTSQSGRDARWVGPGSGFHFTGQEQEGAEGDYMHYFGARYYSAGLGRFASPDGVLIGQYPEDPQSWNLYGYARNNPHRFIDPTGRECVTLAGGGIGDNGVGAPCKDTSLQITHGVTVNGTTGQATSGVYGNAVLMGDIDLGGRKDRIQSQTAEIASYVAPYFKAGLAAGGLAMAFRAGGMTLLERVAGAICISGARFGTSAIVGTMSNGALVNIGVEVSGATMTATVFGVTGATGAEATGATLLPLARGLIRGLTGRRL